MKILYLLIIVLSYFSCISLCQSTYEMKQDTVFLYWDDLTITKKESILLSVKTDTLALKYYESGFHKLNIMDIEKLLENIISGDKKNKDIAFYFCILNQLSINSDGEVSEILGKYCLKFLLDNPDYVLNYFISHRKVQAIYANFIGDELYFKEKGLSTIEYNYVDFKHIMESKIVLKEKYKNVLYEFFSNIQKSMEKLN